MTKQGLIELGIGAAWLVGLAAAIRTGDIFLTQSPLGAAVVGAVIADLGATRARVRWQGTPGDEPKEAKKEAGKKKAEDEPQPDRAQQAREFGLGLGLGLAITAVAFGTSIAAGWASASASGLVSGLVYAVPRAVAIAVRDELLYRGLVLTVARRAGIPARVSLPFAAIAGASAIALAPGASPGAAILALAAGLAFGAMWLTRNGAFAAVGAHTGWNLFTGAGLHGALVDSIFARGELGDGARAAGPPALVAAALWVLVALLLLWKGARGASRGPGKEPGSSTVTT
jgi:hypothetical protein